RHGEEHRRGAGQQRAAALQRLEGVGEGRRFGVVGDGAHLGQVLAHAFLDGRLVVAVADAVERRRLEGQGAGGQQGVVAQGGGGGTGATGGKGQGDRGGK